MQSVSFHNATSSDCFDDVVFTSKGIGKVFSCFSDIGEEQLTAFIVNSNHTTGTVFGVISKDGQIPLVELRPGSVIALLTKQVAVVRPVPFFLDLIKKSSRIL
jgi:hypothetical protein